MAFPAQLVNDNCRRQQDYREGDSMEEERRELCPYCSRPLMKSRRLKFQGGQWRCAHCGAPWPGELELDLDSDESEEAEENMDEETTEEVTADEVQDDQAATDANVEADE